MIFVLFPREGDDEHSIHSSVLVVEMNCALHIIKDLSTLDNKLFTESVPEISIWIVHVSVVET